MADNEELTAQENEARAKLIEQLFEQARTGKKGIDLAIQLYLENAKVGKSLVGLGKATNQVTGGFKDSAKALANSTGNFNDLAGAVSGSINAVSGLLSHLPIVGVAFKALGDAAAETATFAFGQVQSGFQAFQDLSKAGMIGADGISGMADDMRKSRIPLQTYSKLLQDNSQNLAYFSSSASAGGKQFVNVMSNLAGETGKPLRRLGFSIEEIGQSVIDFQTMNQRMGLRQTLTQAELEKKSINYAKELDLVAKLTGLSRKDLQKGREEVASDARFRTKINQLYAENKTAEADALMDYVTTLKAKSPEMARAAQDLVTGVRNTEATTKAMTSGMADTMVDQMEAIEHGGQTSIGALNATAEQAKKMAVVGGYQYEAARVFQSGMAPFINYAELSDLAGVGMKAVTEVANDQKTAMEAANTQTDKLVTAMMKMQEASIVVSSFFINSSVAADTIDTFSGALHSTILFIEEMIADANKSVTEKVGEYLYDVNPTKEHGELLGQALYTIVNNPADYNPLQEVGESIGSAASSLVNWFGNDTPPPSAQSHSPQPNSYVPNAIATPAPPAPMTPMTPEVALNLESAKPQSVEPKPIVNFAEEAAKAKATLAEQEAMFNKFKKDAKADGDYSKAEQREAREMKTLLNAIRMELISLNSMAKQQKDAADNTTKAIQQN